MVTAKKRGPTKKKAGKDVDPAGMLEKLMLGALLSKLAGAGLPGQAPAERDSIAIFGGVKIDCATGTKTPIIGIQIGSEKYTVPLDKVDGLKKHIDVAAEEVRARWAEMQAAEAKAAKSPKKG